MKPPPDDALDQDLMHAVGRGDRRAFALVVERHYGWTLGFADRLLGNRHEAEDQVQTAFLRVWQYAPRWEANAKFSTWLYRVLYNLCMDQLRARRSGAIELLDDDVAEAMADEAPSGEERLSVRQRDGSVREALERLPVRQKAAIVLCYYEERSQVEAAALLGVSEGALESLLSRGRATLRKWLRDDLQ